MVRDWGWRDCQVKIYLMNPFTIPADDDVRRDINGSSGGGGGSNNDDLNDGGGDNHDVNDDDNHPMSVWPLDK